MYSVISKPKRQSMNSGLLQVMIDLLKMIEFRHSDCASRRLDCEAGDSCSHKEIGNTHATCTVEVLMPWKEGRAALSIKMVLAG